MHQYECFFNTARPHQGIGQKIPKPPLESSTSGTIKRRDLLGGVLNLGKVIFNGTPNELVQRAKGRVWQFLVVWSGFIIVTYTQDDYQSILCLDYCVIAPSPDAGSGPRVIHAVRHRQQQFRPHDLLGGHTLGATQALQQRVSALEHQRNAAKATIHWRFTTVDARQKLARLYPKLDTAEQKAL
jgi:hypothetical protein